MHEYSIEVYLVEVIRIIPKQAFERKNFLNWAKEKHCKDCAFWNDCPEEYMCPPLEDAYNAVLELRKELEGDE